MKGGLMSTRVTVCNESCAAEKQRGLTSNYVSGWVSGHGSGAASVTWCLMTCGKSFRRQKSDLTVHLKRHFVLPAFTVVACVPHVSLHPSACLLFPTSFFQVSRSLFLSIQLFFLTWPFTVNSDDEYQFNQLKCLLSVIELKCRATELRIQNSELLIVEYLERIEPVKLKFDVGGAERWN